MTAYPITPKIIVFGAIISLLFLSGWEIYCRSEGYIATPDSTKALWAENRGRLRDNDPDQVVLISASRGHFDFQLDEWEAMTGIRPIQLGAGGRGPAAGFQDIVDNTQYTGTIVMNITPGLFFVPPADSVFGWWRGKAWVDYYHDRTYAQRLNHRLSYLLQPYLAFLTSDTEGDPDLKSLIASVQIPGRTKSGPPFPRFSYVDKDRGVTMMEKISTDTAFAAIIQRVWTHDSDSVNKLEDAKPVIFDFYFDNIKKFKDRGGKVIFTRNPSHGGVRDFERLTHPRKEYWDKFIEQSGCPGYHFDDYPQLSQFFTPEWSHLATPDAKIYTKEILTIMQKDGIF
jgi:hypothetical protein